MRAALHAVDPAAAGLAESRTREVPGADALDNRLAAGCPDSGGSWLVAPTRP